MFSITVFVPLFLQTATGATPTEAGLLLVPAMLGITVSTAVAGRTIARTGRYKIFPLAGLAMLTAALALLAALASDASRVASVDRRELGIATATTGFFRALGGAVGAAGLGAVFAAHAGAGASPSDVIGGVQAEFLVAAPIAALALAVVLFLREVPLEQR